MFPAAALKEGTMAEAKLAPNLPDWMVEHANRYVASGGTDGHMYKINVPPRGEITVPALLLTTTGRKSGDKFMFPLFYGTDGGSYFVIASKGGAQKGARILAALRRLSAQDRARDTGGRTGSSLLGYLVASHRSDGMALFARLFHFALTGMRGPLTLPDH
jgi:hypothetical protein